MFHTSLRLSSHYCKRIVLSKPVEAALNNKSGVVALESTVITHGLPYPVNLETALHLEEEVRQGGSEPATIALLDGEIHIGLNREQLQRVSDSMDSVKVSRRDIPYALAQNLVGGTTVAATMFLANLAGIKVFATGGIGGVHRGAEETFDISADLQELARTPVTVVCAGVKSILDIAKTVEYLETHSVNTIVYGPVNSFPGFFTSRTSSKAQFATESLEEIVKTLGVATELGLEAGTILACPIPKQYEGDGKIIEDAIQKALTESKEQQIKSQKITPFLLSRVNELTEGASMRTNIALLRNNARIGGRLAKLLAETTPRIVSKPESQPMLTNLSSKPKITIIGATIVDFEAITQEDVKDDGASYRGIVTQRCGGVARNHADALARLGCDATFISAVGNDSYGQYFFEKCSHINTSRVEVIRNLPTAVYLAMNSKGNVRFGINSLGEIVDRITPDLILKNEDVIADSKYVLLDGNLSIQTISKAIELAEFYNVPVWFEPTDVFKTRKIFDGQAEKRITAVSPNANEFREWVKMKGLTLPENVLADPESLSHYVEKNVKLFENLSLLLISLSNNGTVVFKTDEEHTSKFILPPPVKNSDVITSVSGAGDSLNSGILAGLVHGLKFEDCLHLGQTCAELTLKTTEAVSLSINSNLLNKF
ncbi:unnamed protein product [Auanema sp. JU1783]|nr:unnamed protein product [Auanema sp. JU1783]